MKKMVEPMNQSMDDDILCRYLLYNTIPPNIQFTTPILTLSRETAHEHMRSIGDLIPSAGQGALYWIRVCWTDGRIVSKIGYSADVVRRLGYDYFRREPYAMMVAEIEIYGIFFIDSASIQERNWLEATRDLEIKPFADSHRINTKEFRQDFVNNQDMQQHIWAFCQGLQSVVRCIVG